MAAAIDEFSVWLGNKLQALNTDESVFGSYITGILDGDETLEEKTDALEGILSEIVEKDLSTVCAEILDKWQRCRVAALETAAAGGGRPSEDVDDKLVRLLGGQTLATTVQRSEQSAEQRALRDAILAQYGQTTDSEDEDGEPGTGSGAGATTQLSDSAQPLERNTNALSVQLAEKEKRDAAKQDSQKKKDRDKEDREKQKQMREEKKEKRKTQKGERKR